MIQRCTSVLSIVLRRQSKWEFWDWSSVGESRIDLTGLLLIIVIDGMENMIPLNVMFGIITILIDILTVAQLFRLAVNVTTGTTTDKIWEENMERFMNPRIHPDFAWVFGVRFCHDFQKSDLDSNSNSNGNGNSNDNDMNAKSATIETACPESKDNNNNTLSGNDDQRDKKQQQQRQPIVKLSDIPQLCSIIYYLNPITILSTSIFPSFQGIQYLLLVTIFQQVTVTAKSENQMKPKQLLQSTFFLAILSYFEFFYVIFLVPLFFWCTRNNYCIGNERSYTGNKTNQQQHQQLIGCKFS